MTKTVQRKKGGIEPFNDDAKHSTGFIVSVLTLLMHTASNFARKIVALTRLNCYNVPFIYTRMGAMLFYFFGTPLTMC